MRLVFGIVGRTVEIGSWQHDVQNMDTLRTYKLLKTDFGSPL